MKNWIMIPSGYRMIGSGDVVPVFHDFDPPRYLIFHEDGSVTWTTEDPEPVTDGS